MSDHTSSSEEPGDAQIADLFDELEFSIGELEIFSRGVTFFADGFVEEFRGPLLWRAEAIAIFCKQTVQMVKAIGQRLEEARQHAP